MPAPRKLAHIVFASSQRDAMRDWYCKVLSAKVQFENELLCFLAYDDEHHRIAIGQIPGLRKPPVGATGLQHVAFTHGDLADLLQTFEDLNGEGIHPIWCVNHGTTTSIYYADPDENWVELQVDNFATIEECNDYMRSDQFAANPIGVQFNPSDYLARLRAGESSVDLLSELALVNGEPVGPPLTMP